MAVYSPLVWPTNAVLIAIYVVRNIKKENRPFKLNINAAWEHSNDN